MNRFPFLVDGGMHYQQIYGAGEFAGQTEPILITELAFRMDSNSGDPFSRTINNLTIGLSTASAAVDGLSPSFANNLGADNTTVFSGSLNLSSADPPGPGNTRAFDVLISFQTPFLYDPSAGNLLLDVLNLDPANNSIGTFFDAADVTGDSVSRLYSTEGFPNFATGFLSTSGLITRFTTRDATVPEPASFALFGLGTLSLCFAARRRKRCLAA